MGKNNQFKYKHKILVIDDEQGILKAVKRTLKRLPCETTISNSPKEALEIVKESKPPFSLIISDQRMPEMEGSAFLEKTKKISPYSVRFLITGYTDMDALIEAINKGGIHRFIAKPWDDEDFLQIITEGLKQYELVLENKRLMAVVAKQNKELGQTNENLEKKVKERTQEIAKKNAELVQTNKNLTESLFNTIRSLNSMVAMVAPQLSAHGQRVSELSITLGQKLGLSAEELRTLEIASLLHDIGKISTGFSKLDSNSPEYKKHPETGQDILKYIPQLKTCSEIIRHHHENYDGSGFPDGLEEKNIPIGSRIIAITDTYDKLHINRKKRDIAVYNFLNTKKVSADNFKRKELFENGAMYYLQQNTFSLFDPDILKVMLDLIKSKKLNYKVEITVKPEELNTGDVITEPVYTDSGALLFTKDTKISDQELDKLTLILKSEALKTPLKIIENFSSNQ